MSKEFQTQFELAAAALRAARKRVRETKETKTYADRAYEKAHEDEINASQRFHGFVYRMLEEPLA